MTIKKEITIEEAKQQAIKELKKLAKKISAYFDLVNKELVPNMDDDTLYSVGGLLTCINSILGDETRLDKLINQAIADKLKSISHH